MTTTAPREDGVVLARPEASMLVLAGDVDLSAVEAFDRAADGTGDAAGDLSWVRRIDVSGVTFIDTQGLGLLLRVAAPRGRPAPEPRPELLGTPPQVRQLLEMLGVEQLFAAHPSEDGSAGAGTGGAPVR